MKRTKELLIFLGTAIVVSTYIVKDIYRESLKDDLTTIESAQNLFLMQQENAGSSTTLYGIWADVLLIGGLSAPKDDNLGKVRERFLQELNSMRTEPLKDAVQQTENVVRLLERLPRNADEQEHLKLYKEDLAVVKSKAAMIESEYEKANSRMGIEYPLLDDSHWNATIRSYESFLKSDAELLKSMERNATDALAQAQKKEDERRSRYEQFKTASIYLYFVGLLVGLIGRLKGVDGVGEGDS